MACRATCAFATTAPSHVIGVAVGTSYHTATACSRPHDIISLSFHVLDLCKADLIYMEKTKLRVLLSRFYHSSHFIDKRLNLLFCGLELFFQVPAGPFELIVLILQLLFLLHLFCLFRIVNLLGRQLPLPLHFFGIILRQVTCLLLCFFDFYVLVI